ncbi:hypothetical protein [Cellulosimicrobium protaetiae]
MTRHEVKVDEQRLDQDERREFARRGKVLAPEVEERWTGVRRFVHAFQATCLAGGALVALIGWSTDVDVVFAAGVFVAIFGGVFWIVVLGWVEEYQSWRAPRILAQQKVDFLTEIGYDERPSPQPNRTSWADDHQPYYWATGDYDPDRMGRIVRSHSPYELDAMRDYGMSADEWDANRPD